MTEMTGTEKTDSVAARLEELEAAVRALKAHRVRRHPRKERGAGSEAMSRRRLFGLLGSAAAVGTGIAVAGSALGADPAEATTGTMMFGQGNDAGTAETTLTSTNATATLGVANTDSFLNSQNAYGVSATSNSVAAVLGTNNGFGAALEGTAAQTGAVGVHANAANGYGVKVEAPALTTGGAHLFLVPAASGTTPTTAAHALGELWMSGSGALFLCVQAGTPGTWKELSDCLALHGVNDNANSTVMLTNGGGTTLSVTAQAAGCTAIVATNNDAVVAAVAATNNLGGPGLQGGANGTGPQLNLIGGAVVGPPTGAHTKGDFFVDSNGALWYATTTGNPSTWVNLSTGSKLITLAAPHRVFDSRTGQDNQPPNVQGSLTFTSPPPSATHRTISCNKDAHSGSPVIPSGATSLLMNLTVISISGVGALAVYPTSGSQPNSSSINWSAGGQVLANGLTSACNSSQQVDVAIVASSGASTDFILDVIGYYL